jgi:hypothetical protein
MRQLLLICYAAVNGLVQHNSEKFRHCKKGWRILAAKAVIEAAF